MFVLKSTYERDVNALRLEIRDLTDVLENVDAKALKKAHEKASKSRGEEITLAAFPLDFEEMPLPTDKKPLPSRLEYDERLAKAIEMFRQRKNRSYVEKALDISRTSARRYLQIAVAKRKVKKADYDELNQ